MGDRGQCVDWKKVIQISLAFWPGSRDVGKQSFRGVAKDLLLGLGMRRIVLVGDLWHSGIQNDHAVSAFGGKTPSAIS